MNWVNVVLVSLNSNVVNVVLISFWCNGIEVLGIMIYSKVSIEVVRKNGNSVS